MKVYPSSGAAWATAALMLLGGLLGWLLNPLLWLAVGGPFRWSALLMATAAAESQWNSAAVGLEANGTRSVGVLQYNDATWPTLAGTAFNRESAFWSGYFAAKYVTGALLVDVRFWALAIPVYGLAVMRLMWRCGTSSYAADKVWSAADYTEDVAWQAGTLWGVVGWILSLPFWWWITRRVKVRR